MCKNVLAHKTITGFEFWITFAILNFTTGCLVTSNSVLAMFNSWVKE